MKKINYNQLTIKSLFAGVILNYVLPFTYINGFVTKPIFGKGNTFFIVIYTVLVFVFLLAVSPKDEINKGKIFLDKPKDIPKTILRSILEILFAIVFLLIVPALGGVFLFWSLHLSGKSTGLILLCYILALVVIGKKTYWGKFYNRKISNMSVLNMESKSKITSQIPMDNNLENNLLGLEKIHMPVNIKSIKQYYFSLLRIGFLFFFGGFTATFLTMLFSSDGTYRVFFGISIYGVIYIVQILAAMWGLKNKSEAELIEIQKQVKEISHLRVSLETLFLVITVVGTAFYIATFYVKPFHESSYYGAPQAEFVDSTQIPDWVEVGKESGIVTFALPGIPNVDWGETRIDNGTPTKNLAYDYYTDQNSSYSFIIEWLNNDKGERIYTPNMEWELKIAKDYFEQGEGSILTQADIDIVGVKGVKYEVVNNSRDRKLAGVFFVKDNVFYDISVWPADPSYAKEELEKIVSSLKFTDHK